MKKLLLNVISVLLLGLLPYSTKAPVHQRNLFIRRNYQYLMQQQQLQKEQELSKFLFQLSLRESHHRWDIINTLGYLGKYQFGKATLDSIGYSHVTKRKFKVNPLIFSEQDQDIAVRILIKRNEKYLEQYIAMYEHSTINGIYITKSGILAAAHLAGYVNVKKFLVSNGKRTTKDKYGTGLTCYLKEFANYKL